MTPTLQLDLTAAREIARRVADIAGTITTHSFRLRVSDGAPATDSITLSISRRLRGTALVVAYTAEGAADELMRATEALLAYAHNGAALARRTELAVMGLDLDVLSPDFDVSPRRAPRGVNPPTPHQELIPPSDHRTLSEAVLLSAGLDTIAHSVIDVAQVRAAAGDLHGCARGLRAAMGGSGERPAATLDHFASWLDDDFGTALTALGAELDSWSASYARAREQVRRPASTYRRWLVEAAGGGAEVPDLTAAAAQARAALRAYALIELGGVVCAPHPRLGGEG